MIKDIVSHREGFGERSFFIRQAEQVLVRNDDQRVDHLLQCLNTLFSLTHALCTLKLERLCNHTNSQNTQLTRRLRDDWRCTCTGATTHARSDKAHVRTREMVNDLLNAFFGSGSTNRRARTSPKAFSHFHTKLDFRWRARLLQCLRVCVGDHELNTLKGFFDHVINSVTASAPNTENSDAGFEIFLSGHGEIKCHSDISA